MSIIIGVPETLSAEQIGQLKETSRLQGYDQGYAQYPIDHPNGGGGIPPVYRVVTMNSTNNTIQVRSSSGTYQSVLGANANPLGSNSFLVSDLVAGSPIKIFAAQVGNYRVTRNFATSDFSGSIFTDHTGNDEFCTIDLSTYTGGDIFISISQIPVSQNVPA